MRQKPHVCARRPGRSGRSRETILSFSINLPLLRLLVSFTVRNSFLRVSRRMRSVLFERKKNAFEVTNTHVEAINLGKSNKR